MAALPQGIRHTGDIVVNSGDGYKRHVLTDLDLGVIRAVRITAANEAEAIVVESLDSDLKSQNQEMVELHIDGAYLSSRCVNEGKLINILPSLACKKCEGF